MGFDRRVLMRLNFLFLFAFLLAWPFLQSPYAYGDDIMNTARMAYEDGFYDVAETALKRLISQGGNTDFSVISLLAKVYAATGRHKENIALISNALKNQVWAKDETGQLKLLLADSLKEEKDYKGAEENLRWILSSQTEDSQIIRDAIIALKDIFRLTKKYEEGIAFFKLYAADGKGKEISEALDFSIAELTYRKGDADGAQSQFLRFIKEYPGSGFLPSAFFYLGEISLLRNRFDDAIAYYDKVISMYPNEYWGGKAYMGKGWVYIKKGDIESAKKQFAKANELISPPTEALLFGNGVIEIKSGRYREGIEILQSMLNRFPDGEWRRDALYWLGEAYFNLKEWQKAVRQYQSAIKLSGLAIDEVVKNSYYGMAWSYLNQGEYRKAIEAFQFLVDYVDDPIVKVSAMCKIADTYYVKGDYDTAIARYNDILINHPQNYYADYILYQIGNCFLEKKDYEKAALSYERVAKDYPDSQFINEVDYNLALTYFNLGQFERTVSILEKLSQSKKSFDPNITYVLGTAYYNLGNYKAALKLFKKLLRNIDESHPLRLESEYELAWAYFRLGREAEAISRFRRLCKRYPDDPLVQDLSLWLSEYYISKTNYNSAKEILSTLLENYSDAERDNPVRNRALYNLGWINYMEGDKDKALERFRQILDKKAVSSDAALAAAHILSEQGNIDEAATLLEQVIERDRGKAKIAATTLAELYESKGRYADAVFFLEKAITLPPLGQEWHYHFKIGQIWQGIGEYDKAIDAYLTAGYTSKDKDVDTYIRAYLRAGQLLEKKRQFDKALKAYEKVAQLDAPEAKEAQERIERLKQQGL